MSKKKRKLNKSEELAIRIDLLELKLQLAILEAEIRMAKLYWRI